jgi:hypothetical protein
VSIRSTLASTLPCLFLLAGCASFPSPAEQLATSQAAIRAAEEAGAEKDPQAQLYLKLAQENLDKGKQRMEADDNEIADRALRKAEADGELARGIARSKTAQAAADEAKQALSKIKPIN